MRMVLRCDCGCARPGRLVALVVVGGGWWWLVHSTIYVRGADFKDL